MNYLSELDFTIEEVNTLKEKATSLVLEELSKNKNLVKRNLLFLKNYGVINYKNIFIDFPEIFLKEPSLFDEMFLKYRKEDLIYQLRGNTQLVLYL